MAESSENIYRTHHVGELGQRRGERGVGAGIGRACCKGAERDRDGKVDGPRRLGGAKAVRAYAPGEGEGLHMELRLEG